MRPADITGKRGGADKEKLETKKARTAPEKAAAKAAASASHAVRTSVTSVAEIQPPDAETQPWHDAETQAPGKAETVAPAAASSPASLAAKAEAVAPAAARSPASLAAGAVAPESQYVCMEAAELLKRYATGVQRIPLNKLGVSPHNRDVSGKHVHKLGRRIVSVEGFCRYRYNHGWAHEPNPLDPLEVARNTNRVARRDKLLAPVPEEPLYGSFAKTHLLSFLQALKSGCIYWADNEELMLPPPAQAALVEHLEHGMFFEILPFVAVREHPKALQALIASDNFDAGFALGQTEMQLLRGMHSCMQILRPPPGKSQWNVVQEHVQRTIGANWPDEDLICFYNFCKVVGEAHLSFLADVVTLFVDVDKVTVRPSDFQAVSRLPPALVWCKIMFIAMQYLSQADKMVPGPQGKSFGAQLAKADLERFAKLAVETLMLVETFVAKVMATYTSASLQDVSPETLARELPAFLVRTGKAVVLCRNADMQSMDMMNIEQKLRENLKSTLLPKPIAEQTRPASGESCWKTTKASKQVQPDDTPALQFSEQGVVLDEIAQARASGLVVGALVICRTELRGIRAGACGTVTQVGVELTVQWQPGSRLDGRDTKPTSCEETCMTMASVVLASQQPSEGRKTSEPPKTVELPAGISWLNRRPVEADLAIQSLVHATLYQLYVTHSVTAEVLRLTDETTRRLVAVRDIPARHLVLLPWVLAFGKAAKLSKQRSFELVVEVSGDKHCFELREPKPLETQQTTEAGESVVTCPFWQAFHVQREQGLVLAMHTAMFTVPLGTCVSKDSHVRAPKPDRSSVVITVPYLSNGALVKAGDCVWAD